MATFTDPRCSMLTPRLSLTLTLLQAREAAMAFFRPLLNHHGLTEQQWRVIRLLLRSLVSQVTHLDAQAATPEEGVALSEALHALLIPALDQRRDLPLESIENHTLIGLKRSALAMIDASLGQPLLSPNWLAQELGVSVRNLYRAAEEGLSICQSIMHARLKRSAADLSSPMFQHASITEIAYRWGFTDSAHFSRAFRKRFSCTPKDYRRNATAI